MLGQRFAPAVEFFIAEPITRHRLLPRNRASIDRGNDGGFAAGDPTTGVGCRQSPPKFFMSGDISPGIQ